ncbi:hypothetical protein ACU686_01055 [Yinghuangia aomiensis]
MFTAAVVNADPDAAVPWLATAYVPAPSLETLVRACGPLPAGAIPLARRRHRGSPGVRARGRAGARDLAVQRAGRQRRPEGHRLRHFASRGLPVR